MRTPEESLRLWREKRQREDEELAKDLGPEPATLAEHARREAILAAARKGRR